MYFDDLNNVLFAKITLELSTINHQRKEELEMTKMFSSFKETYMNRSSFPRKTSFLFIIDIDPPKDV